jgi:hypothetical protein
LSDRPAPSAAPTRRPLRVAVATLALLGVGGASVAYAVSDLDLRTQEGYAAAHGAPGPAPTAASGRPVQEGPVPQGECGPGSRPETDLQGRVPAADYASGRVLEGYTCNAERVANLGQAGGYKVHRYTDAAGRSCAFFDSTLLFPKDVADLDVTGTYVMDMRDPAAPVRTAVLSTPAMQTPHESLVLSERRGLLMAVSGNPVTEPGVVDIYDVSQDCRTPVLQSSTPLGILGHESGLAPDGRTFYVSSLSGGTVTAIDVSDPRLPRTVWASTDYEIHGMNVSDDGNRLYLADNGRPGLTILDVSQVQSRQLLPQVREVSHVSWPEVSIPQNVLPVTIKGKPFLVEIDEFARRPSRYDPADPVGAGRIIDVSDETAPRVVSDLRLEVNEPEARAGEQKNDPQAQNGLQGYAGHYCAVPSRVDPEIVACSFILSGLRVFDIRDPYRPKEIAYYNAPVPVSATSRESGAYAMSAPAFVPERSEIWYTDGNSGFHVVRLTNGVWPRR